MVYVFYLNLRSTIVTTTFLVILLSTIKIVNFFKDDHPSNAEENVDLEMQELKEFSMYSPATLAAKNRKDSLAASSTDDGKQ